MTREAVWFTARLLFEQGITGSTEPPALFEERLVLLKSDSGPAGAEKKAARLGRDASHNYTNVDGETVTWTFREVLDVFELNNFELREGSEVYSRYLSAEDIQSVRASLSASRL
ncbi:MAG TPA: DUF4288 domain-containing protein [Dehalococcoidia bacterium]|nr:DUF4288 domain-containing protein [Dehalococcoidia bacterium]